MALSKDFRNLLKAAELADTNDQKFASRQVMEALGALAMWVEAGDTLIQWNGDEGYNAAVASTMAPAAAVLSVSATAAVTNDANIPNPFRQNASCVVTLTGTATDKKVNGVAGPLTVSLVDGKADLTLSATSTGTIIATLSAGLPSPLSATDVLTVTLS